MSSASSSDLDEVFALEDAKVLFTNDSTRTPSPPAIPVSFEDMQSTPLHFKSSSVDRYASTQEGMPASERYKRLAEEANLRFVGCMKVGKFLEKYVPRATIRRPKNATLDISYGRKKPRNNEERVVRALNGSNLCPGTTFVHSASTTALFDHVDRRVDVRGLSKQTVKAKRGRKGKKAVLPPADAMWSLTELWIEIKRRGQDAFRDPDAKLSRDERKEFDIQNPTNDGVLTRGQLLEYATSIFASQNRVFFFSVLVTGDFARLIRWDRCGAIVTEEFHWVDEPWLAEFLWRFDRMTPEQRGHDTTVCSNPTEEEAIRARAAFRESDPSGFEEAEKLHKIMVYDGDSDETYGIIVGSPRWYSRSMFGRGTFGYVGFNLHTGLLVWLKDYWRVDRATYPKEETFYKTLAENSIPHTARKIYAGDVKGQATRTQDFVNSPWACAVTDDLLPLVHYRIVIDQIGRPLRGFNSLKQLCQVICDCIVAHWAVFKELKILHYDISAENILIRSDGRGLLVDWDMARNVSQKSGIRARRELCSGTWQFRSAKLAMSVGTIPHLLSDDLESFVHVLAFHLFRYRPSTYTMESLVTQLKRVYDGFILEHGIRKGDEDKKSFFTDHKLSIRYIKDLHPACVNIVTRLRTLFSTAFYADSALVDLSKRKTAQKYLKKSELVLQIFNDNLNAPGWDEDDNSGSVDQLLHGPVAAKTVFDFGSSGISHRTATIPKASLEYDWHSPDHSSAEGGDDSNTEEQSHVHKRPRIATAAQGPWAEASGPVASSLREDSDDLE
ncbi:hypothetical protein OF83DRAFT_1129717 [Amylostereum chailletii]|nr:hypothetical protein OF83DRAFT_1129717 [Amylostereum chailletii]